MLGIGKRLQKSSLLGHFLASEVGALSQLGLFSIALLLSPIKESCSSQNHTADVPGTQVLVTQTQPAHPWVALRFWCLCPALFMFISFLRPPRMSCAPLPETHFVSAPFLLVPNPAPQVEALGWGMVRTEVLQFILFLFCSQMQGFGYWRPPLASAKA